MKKALISLLFTLPFAGMLQAWPGRKATSSQPTDAAEVVDSLGPAARWLHNCACATERQELSYSRLPHKYGQKRVYNFLTKIPGDKPLDVSVNPDDSTLCDQLMGVVVNAGVLELRAKGLVDNVAREELYKGASVFNFDVRGCALASPTLVEAIRKHTKALRPMPEWPCSPGLLKAYMEHCNQLLEPLIFPTSYGE